MTFADFLRAEHFYRPSHRLIYEAISRLAVRNEPCDPITVEAELTRLGKLDATGGGQYLIEILEKARHAAHAKYYGELIVAASRRRESILALLQGVDDLRNETKDDIETISGVDSALLKIIEGTGMKTAVSISDELHALARRIEEGHKPGLATGFCDLDRLIMGGFFPGQLVILAVRPCCGKTTFAVNVVRNVAKSTGVLFVSLEESRAEITGAWFVPWCKFRSTCCDRRDPPGMPCETR